MSCGVERGGGGSAEEVGGGESGDIIYDAGGGIWRIAVALQRARGCGGGIADREPAGRADGRDDWVLREHAGDAVAGEGRDEFPEVVAAGEGDGIGSIPASGYSV